MQEYDARTGTKQAPKYLHTWEDAGVQMRTPTSQTPETQPASPIAGLSEGTSASGAEGVEQR